MKLRTHYLKTEFIRVFCGWQIWTAVAGLFLIFVFGVTMSMESSLEAVSQAFYGMTGVFSLVICAFPYVGSFCEDMEHQYLTAQCIRGSTRSFIRYRIFMIFLSSVFTMTMGVLLRLEYIELEFRRGLPSLTYVTSALFILLAVCCVLLWLRARRINFQWNDEEVQ